MRLLLNIFAVIIGAASALWALTGCIGFGVILLAWFTGDKSGVTQAGGWIVIASCAVAVVIGSVIASRALLHLRHPDRGTANDIVGIVTFLLVIPFLNILTGRWKIPLFQGPHGPTAELWIGLGALVAFYLFYRFVMKRIAERAFPADAAPPASASPA